MLMTAMDLVHNSNDHSPDAIRTGMSAALCRCTGYVGIIDAVTEYVRQVHGDAAMVEVAAPDSGERFDG
jgi:carbon-monoxide dehydrogenase small subunit